MQKEFYLQNMSVESASWIYFQDALMGRFFIEGTELSQVFRFLDSHVRGELARLPSLADRDVELGFDATSCLLRFEFTGLMIFRMEGRRSTGDGTRVASSSQP